MEIIDVTAAQFKLLLDCERMYAPVSRVEHEIFEAVLLDFVTGNPVVVDCHMHYGGRDYSLSVSPYYDVTCLLDGICCEPYIAGPFGVSSEIWRLVS